MSFADAFGPAPKKGSDAAAIQWCRSSIYARLGPGHTHRSPLSIALLYAAELAARVDDPDLPRDRRRKLEAARAALEKLSHAECLATLETVRESIEAAPDDAARAWARRVEAVLCELAQATAPPDVQEALAARKERIASTVAAHEAKVDAVIAKRIARIDELVAEGMSDEEAAATAAAEIPAPDPPRNVT